MYIYIAISLTLILVQPHSLDRHLHSLLHHASVHPEIPIPRPRIHTAHRLRTHATLPSQLPFGHIFSILQSHVVRQPLIAPKSPLRRKQLVQERLRHHPDDVRHARAVRRYHDVQMHEQLDLLPARRLLQRNLLEVQFVAEFVSKPFEHFVVIQQFPLSLPLYQNSRQFFPLLLPMKRPMKLPIRRRAKQICRQRLPDETPGPRGFPGLRDHHPAVADRPLGRLPRGKVPRSQSRGEGVQKEVEELRGPGAGRYAGLLGDDDLGDPRELFGMEEDAENDGSSLQNVENVGVLARVQKERVVRP